MSVKNNIKKILKEKGMTKADLMRKTGLKKGVIYSLSEGTSVKSMTIIADALDTTINEITGKKENNDLLKLSKRYDVLSEEEKNTIYRILETAIIASEKGKK